MMIKKRDGHEVPYDREKIKAAVEKAVKAAGEVALLDTVVDDIEKEIFSEERVLGVEEIQDLTERQLMKHSLYASAKAFCLYREKRAQAREAGHELMKRVDEVLHVSAKDSNEKRENANIDGNTAMGAMLQIGSSCSRAYNELYLLRPEQAKAHRDGDIHIHDFDFYALTMTCCQIDILKLLHGGFSTGHGFLREPQSIQSYAALAAIAIQSNQNDMQCASFLHKLLRNAQVK